MRLDAMDGADEVIITSVGSNQTKEATHDDFSYRAGARRREEKIDAFKSADASSTLGVVYVAIVLPHGLCMDRDHCSREFWRKRSQICPLAIETGSVIVLGGVIFFDRHKDFRSI